MMVPLWDVTEYERNIKWSEKNVLVQNVNIYPEKKRKKKEKKKRAVIKLQKDFVHIVSSKALLRANTFGQMGSPRRLFSRLFLPLGKKRYTITGIDLLCKVHNPLKRLFGHEKNRQSHTDPVCEFFSKNYLMAKLLQNNSKEMIHFRIYGTSRREIAFPAKYIYFQGL